MAKRGPKKKQFNPLDGPSFEDVLREMGTLPPGMTPEMALSALREIMSGAMAPLDPYESAPPRPRKRRSSKTADGRALKLVDKAEATNDDRQRAKYLAQALQEDPDCAAALILQAFDTPSSSQAIKLYEQALDASERKLGPGFKEKYAGRFQEVESTSYYLTALIGIARRYNQEQEYDRAVDCLEQLLAIEPNAPSEVKAEALAIYLDMEDNERARDLVERFPHEDGIIWAAGRMLLEYRLHGDSKEARQLFQVIWEQNALVIEKLLNDVEPTEAGDNYAESLDEWQFEEADTVAILYMRAWPITPGGLAWLRRLCGERERAPGESDDLPPWSELAYELSTLGRSGETWLVDLIPSETPQRGKSTDWTTMICDGEDFHPVGVYTLQRKPASEEILSQLAQTMLGFDGEEPRLPERVVVREAALAKKLTPKLKRHRIACEVGGDWTFFDEMAQQLMRAQKSSAEGLDLVPISTAELAELPMEPGEVWQVDMRRAAAWAMDFGTPQRMNLALVCVRGERMIVQQQLFAFPLNDEQLWALVSHAMLNPMVETPRRPGTIEVTSNARREAFNKHLDALGVDCVVVDTLDTINDAIQSLTGFLQEKHGQDNPAITTAPGVERNHLAAFYQAAATFFKRRVWRWVLPDRRINVRTPDLSCGSVDVVVLGQMGEVLGLAVHEDRDALDTMLKKQLEQTGDDDFSSDASFRSAYLDQSGMSILFGEAIEIAFADLDAIEDEGYVVAAPEAYPKIMHFEHGILRAPLAWEIDLLTGILSALPDFVSQHRHDPAASVAAFTPQGKQLTISWVV